MIWMPKRDLWVRRALTLCVVMALAGTVWALPTPEAGLATYPEHGEKVDVRDPGGMWHFADAVERRFGVHVCFESPHPWTYDAWPEGELTFRVAEDETLRDFLDQLGEVTAGQMNWGFLRGMLYIGPTRIPESGRKYLSIKISLDLDGVSTWEAYKQWATAVNAGRKDGPGVWLVVTKPIMRAPGAFTDAKTITLHLEGVTAREALCAITAASPLPISISYSHHDDSPDLASISYIWREGEERREISKEEWQRWLDERRETMVQPGGGPAPKD